MAEEQLTKTPERNYRWTVAALGAVFAAGTAYALFFPFCTEGRVSAWIQHQIPFGRPLALPEASLARPRVPGRTNGRELVVRRRCAARQSRDAGQVDNVSERIGAGYAGDGHGGPSLSATGADAGEVYTRSEAEPEPIP